MILKKAMAACVIGLALVTTFAGCKGSGSSSGGASAGAIKIGFIGPLTGGTSSYGQSSKKGMQLYEEQINKKGGINGRKVEFVAVDDEGKAATTVTVGKRLLSSDKVVAIVGPVTSTCANSLAPICQGSNIPMVVGTGTNANITKAGDCIFRTCFTDTFQGKVMAKFAAEDLKVQTAAILYNKGDDYSEGLAEAFKGSFTGKIVDTESYNTGDKDFNAQLTKIAPLKPDVLFLPEYYSDVAVIAREARSVGITSTLLGGDGFDSPQLFSIGGDAVNGVYFSNHYAADDTSKQVVQFIQSYKAKFSSSPDAFAALTYDACTVLCNSIKKAGSTDANAIKSALKSYDGDLVCGQIKFDGDRNAVKSARIIKTVDGKETLFKKLTA